MAGSDRDRSRVERTLRRWVVGLQARLRRDQEALAAHLTNVLRAKLELDARELVKIDVLESGRGWRIEIENPATTPPRRTYALVDDEGRVISPDGRIVGSVFSDDWSNCRLWGVERSRRVP